MREVLSDVARWRSEGAAVALARVVGVEGSGPREPGAAMAVSADGRVAGSVSGGCVEGAVVESAQAALADGRVRLETFGYSDDEAFAVGLTCGGTLRILVTPGVTPAHDALARSLAIDEPVVLATVVALGEPGEPGAPGSGAPGAGAPGSGVPGSGATGSGATGAGATGALASEAFTADWTYEPDDEDLASGGVGAVARLDRIERGAVLLVHADGRTEGALGDAGLDRVVTRDALGALATGTSVTRHYGRHGQARARDVEVFLEVFAPPPKMVIFGAVDFTAALARVAKVLGYRVTVCDARPVFATRARFPMADEVVVDWPDRFLRARGAELSARDAVCVLTHDPKFDVPAIRAALETEVGYLGAMGSRRTHLERTRRLLEAGVAPGDLERVMGPIGIDIGARTPEETAISICAEIIALRTGRPAVSLRDREGPIHQPQPVSAAR